MSDPERNKDNAQAFYDLMFNQSNPRDAIDKFVGAEYIQHNPEVGDGKEAFIQYFERMAAEYPGKSVVFKRVFADGDHVILHAIKRGQAIMNMRELIFSDSMAMARLLSTGTYFR